MFEAKKNLEWLDIVQNMFKVLNIFVRVRESGIERGRSLADLIYFRIKGLGMQLWHIPPYVASVSN